MSAPQILIERKKLQALSSDKAGLKIALEQAWESNRERQEKIQSLEQALRNFTDGRTISYVDALVEARRVLGDLS